MPRKTEDKSAFRPPSDVDVLEREQNRYRLEFLNPQMKTHHFGANTDADALRHVAHTLEIEYPMEVLQFHRQGGKAVYREGRTVRIYPPPDQAFASSS